MNILVIGSGGREHAIIKSFKKSPVVTNIFALPGNDGMAQDAKLISESTHDFNKIISFCKTQKIDLVFIGPEEPLVQGLADELRHNKILCVGPSKAAAQLEGSKIFAKNFMIRAGVPTAKSFVVTTVKEALNHAKKFTAPYILKADGLAAGKGVFICKNLDELSAAASGLFVNKKLGPAGSIALLEQNLNGHELSFLILTNGENFEALPLAKDHKRLLDNDKGPNTGGMGTVAPMQISDNLYKKIIEEIIKPSVLQIKKENLIYRGILFVGIMVVNDQPYALEYNTRFGDPETQVILPLIENDTAELFFNLANGNLNTIKLNQLSCACLVNAAEGYPENSVQGTPLEYSSEVEENILFAGVKKANNTLVTAGGRVLNIVATADTITAALAQVYELNKKVSFKRRQFRTDIGKN